MINILIDIGNSNIKTAVGFHSRIYSFKRSEYSKQFFTKNFKEAILNFSHRYHVLKSKVTYRDIASINSIGISVLNEDHKAKILKIIKGNYSKKLKSDERNELPEVIHDIFQTHKVIFIARDLNLPFKISYGEGLGNDRIANAAGALKHFQKENILVIDFGTATTYTLIIKKSITGGLISPGVKTSLDALVTNASLPDTGLKFPQKPINDNTIDNIRAGIFFPALYTAERIVSDLKKRYKNLLVIATGGFGELFFERSKLIDKFDEKLSLEGINYLLELNS